MVAKSKEETESTTPTITTHHSMAAGGQPSATHDSSETPAGKEDAKVVLTRPKKLVLQPMHSADASDKPDDEVLKIAPETKEAETLGEDAPLVLETAAETEAAASKLAAKLPEDKIELPLNSDVLEEMPEDELDQPAEQSATVTTPEADAPSDVKDPGESAGAAVEVDPNEARVQKAEALIASGKYAVHIHESSRSRAGLIAAMIAGAVVILATVYFAAAEDMLNVGVDLPKFW